MKQCLLRKVIWNDETNALTVGESSLNYIKSTKCVNCPTAMIYTE